MMSAKPIAAPRSGLGGDVGLPVRRRPVGRIGGVVRADGRLGHDDPAVLRRMRAALGSGAQLLPGAHILGEARRADANGLTAALVADWDSCWQDGQPLTSLDDWRPHLAPERLAAVEGAYVLAWMDEHGTLTLARDPVGERTLFYAATPDGLVFASTLAAVLASGLVPGAVNPVAVARYLSYAYVPGRETLALGVCELLPGECLRYRAGTPRRGRFWGLPAGLPPAGLLADPAPMAERLRAALETAVRRRLPPPGEPVGASLSGGLDSSLVVALASRQHDRPVRTYSVSFGEGYANELPFSSLVAAHCQTEHQIVELSPDTVLRHLDETIGLLSEPIGDPLTVPNALLFRRAAEDAGVILNGEGGDPCFGGPKNLPMVLAELFGDGASGGADDPLARERSYLRAHGKCYDDLDAMLAPDVAQHLRVLPLERELTPLLTDARWPTFVARLMAINITFKGAHHILPKVDHLSAPFGIVPRAPLFDRAVVELAASLPPQLRLRGAVEKWILKQAVRDLLPPSIVERPKSGMLVPVEAWFRGPLLPAARARLLDGLRPYRLFEERYLDALLAGKLGGVRPRIGAKIWLLVTLEAWLRRVLARSLP
ncbi:MAG: asparagine synthase [Chloroflexi bacterium]|nr:asparagine synthase [Chloroflexota bacterium]